jgi:hypothetical protein
MKTTTIVRSVIFIGICLLATKLPSNAQNFFDIAVPNYSFETLDPNRNGNYLNQNPVQYPYNSLPEHVVFTGWESSGYINGPVAVSAGAGNTGNFQGSQAAVVYGFGDIESLNPVTTIIKNATYTLTFAINDPSGAGSTTLQLLATTQGVDPGVYSYYDGTGYVPVSSPYPLISTVPGGMLASSTVSTGGSTGALQFKDYTVSFDTLNGHNASFVGDSLSINAILGDSVAVDNVRLTELAVVPEPSTWALMLAGVAGLIIISRRKLKA